MFENLTLRKDEIKEEEKEPIKDIINILNEPDNDYNDRYQNYIIFGTIFVIITIIILVTRKKNKA